MEAAKGNMNTKVKTIVSFNPFVTAAIVAAYGQDRHDQIVGACQSAMNDPETVKSVEKDSKRGNVRGGIGYGVLPDGGTKTTVKDTKWTTTTPTEHVVQKATAPTEMVKFNDAITGLFKRCGNPSGELTLAIFPRMVVEWFGRLEANAKAKVTLANGATVSLAPATEAPAKATAPTTEATKAAKNGKAKDKATVTA